MTFHRNDAPDIRLWIIFYFPSMHRSGLMQSPFANWMICVANPKCTVPCEHIRKYHISVVVFGCWSANHSTQWHLQWANWNFLTLMFFHCIPKTKQKLLSLSKEPLTGILWMNMYSNQPSRANNQHYIKLENGAIAQLMYSCHAIVTTTKNAKS